MLLHGFYRLKSCDPQLLEFITDVTNNIHNGKQTDILIMDFSKAFHMVEHKHLLAKLIHHDITGWINRRDTELPIQPQTGCDTKWFYNYCRNVTPGMPQWSVLRPCHFLLHINGIPNQLDYTVRLFAEDTMEYLTIQSDDDIQALQHYLNIIFAWEQKW